MYHTWVTEDAIIHVIFLLLNVLQIKLYYKFMHDMTFAKRLYLYSD